VDEVSFDAGSLPPEEQELGQRQEAQIVLGEAVPDERVTDTLRDVFGYDALRPGQATVIGRLLEGADTLAIMPTGAGKSITFQLPSLLIDGLTIVISPLIALMQDQVESMPPRLAAHATFINGTLEPLEMERRMERMAAGDYRLVYVAPERLRHPAFLEALRRAGCARVVIDEAHCISMWGHDFRPDYLYIPHALQLLGDPPVLALTATATPENVHHIGKLLGRRLELVRTSAYRPNLRYEVLRCTGPKEKDAALRAILRQRTGAAIVYVPTRNLAEEVATSLRAAGVTALPYHAGLAGEVRAAHQERFMRGEGSAIVATVAFGMGINKADVRTIVHYAPPKSLEAYIQEAGRAGRDGLPAACVMLVAKGDFVRLRKYANESDVSIEELRAVYRSLRAVAVGRWSIGDRAAFTANEGTGFDPMIGIGLLEQADLVRRHPDTAASFAVRWTERSALHDRRDDSPFERWLARNAAGSAAITVPTASVCAEIGVAPVQLEHLLRTRMGLRVHPQGSAICVELLPEDRHTAQRVNRVLAQLSQVALRQLEAISRYVDGRRCRHVALAAHLGERLDPCGAACDVCAPRPGQADAARQALALETPPVGAHGRASASRRQSPKSAQPSRPVQPSGGPLFEALRAWRLERARQDGMPPYVIAYDRHLEDIARLRPHALNELRQIAGFGQSRIDKYGDEILAVIAREGG
jgi:ATP-dependent DNA helicase RecQ